MQGQWFFQSGTGGQQFSVKSKKYGFTRRQATPARIYLPEMFMGGGDFNVLP